MATVDAHRLFFALWPDPASRAALARMQQQVAGRAVPAANLHLTLAFLGRQPGAALAPLRQILAELDCPALTLNIDCFGHFSGQRIAWAGMRAPPPALLALQAALVARLRLAGFEPDAHGPFRPHVTLARQAPAPELGCEPGCAPLLWPVRQLALLESGAADGLYRVLASREL